MNSDGDCCRHSGEQARVGANEVFFAGNAIFECLSFPMPRIIGLCNSKMAAILVRFGGFVFKYFFSIFAFKKQPARYTRERAIRGNLR